MFTEDDGTPGEGLALRRLRFPARQHGGGLRSRLALRPAAYCASFVSAATRFLHTDAAVGFFGVLEPYFGAGAFEPGGAWLARWLDPDADEGLSPSALAFSQAWAGLRDEVGHGAARGPLDATADVAGRGVDEGLQHAITTQRERFSFQQLRDDIVALPAAHPLRRAFLEAGQISSTLITSWPSTDTGVDIGFADCFAHYALLRPRPAHPPPSGGAPHPLQPGAPCAVRPRRPAQIGQHRGLRRAFGVGWLFRLFGC